MKALVTGASGFIGANLIRELLGRGHEVRAFVRETSDMRALEGLKVEIAHGDVLSFETLAAAAAGCEVLFHTATLFTYWGHTSEELRTLAVEGALNAVKAARRARVRRMVLTSSSVVLGSSAHAVPRDESCEFTEPDAPPYAVAKSLQEQAAFERAAAVGLDIVAVRPTVTVGPCDYRLSTSNAIIVNYLKDSLKATFPGGCNIVSVLDVAHGHVLAAERGVRGEHYVLGSENLEWSMVHRIISELCGMPGPLVYASHTASYVASAFYELLAKLTRKIPPTTRAQAKMVGRFYWYRHDRARELGFAPRPARQALAEAVAWLVASPHVSKALRRRIRLSPEVYEARRSLATTILRGASA